MKIFPEKKIERNKSSKGHFEYFPRSHRSSVCQLPTEKKERLYENSRSNCSICSKHFHVQIKHEHIKNIYIHDDSSKLLVQPLSKKSSKYMSCRWRVAYLALMGLVLQIAHRNCISVALVCMTKKFISNVTVNGTVIEQVQKEFDWSADMEGIILSAYFYGQIISPLISGVLCRRFGVQKPMALYVAISSILLLLTPFLAKFGAWTVITVRSAQGFFGSGCLPMYSHLWSKWAPKKERSQLIAFTFAGLDIGVIVAFTVSGWLCTLSFGRGWPLIFYSFGITSLIWCGLWLNFVTDNPEDNHFITEAEVQLIMCDRQIQTEHKNVSTPWLKILTSGPVIAMVTGMFTIAWGMTVVFSFLPKYMNDVLKYEIHQNGFLSSLPFLGRTISIIVVGRITDVLLNRRIFEVTVMRKINQCGAGVFGAAFIIPVGFLSEGDSLSAVLLITVSSMALGSAMSGAYSNILEIFPRHASTISGLAFAMNGIGQVTAPVIIGQMITHDTRKEWVHVYISIGVVYLVGAAVYALFGSGRSIDTETTATTIDHNEKSFTPNEKIPRTASDQSMLIDLCGRRESVYSVIDKLAAIKVEDKQQVYSITM